MRATALLLPVSIVLLASACKGKDSNPTSEGPDVYVPQTMNAAPTASFTSHRAGDTERDGYAFVLEATVADADNTIGDLDISITANGEDICEDVSMTDDGVISCTITPTEGMLQVVLIASDIEGANAEAAVSITVNPTDAPVANINLPTAANSRYYTDIAVDVAAAISDTETPAAELSVTLSSDLDPDVDFGIAVDADGNLTAGALLSEGVHTLTLSVVDETGKVGQDSVQFEVGPDNNAPLCTIVGPTEGAATLAGADTLLSADISDADVSNDLVRVQWSSDVDGILAEGIASSEEVTDVAVSLTGGVHQLTVTAVDETGADCAATVTHTVSAAPLVAFDSHFDGDILDEGVEVVFSATVGDLETEAASLSVIWSDAAGNILSRDSANTSGVATYATDALAPGAHTIIVKATDADGFSTSAAVSVVVNAQPGEAAISIAPSVPGTSDDLVASIDTEASDADGDAISYTYSWSVDGVFSAVSVIDTLPASATNRGESWSVSVTANDGRINGNPVTATVAIGNEAPVAALVSITPDPATAADDLSCSANGSDADADAITWSYSWTIDGVASSETSNTLPSGAFAKGSEIVCIATPNDGTIDGAAQASSGVTISNSAPVIDSASLSPNPAVSSSSLACNVSATDPDGDSLSYSYAWLVDGVDAGVSTSTLDPAHFSRGNGVVCMVTVSDGSGTDASQNTDAIIIQNSAPDMDAVDITPATATVADDLTCTASGTDYDGDSITYSYFWTVNGAAVGTGASLAAGSFTKGDVVACQAFGNDGTEDGDALESSERMIDNASPSVASVGILPGTARVSDDLTCSTVYSDADGDVLTENYRWAINGADIANSSNILVSGAFSKGDTINCAVEVEDGDIATGFIPSTNLVVSNTKPAVSSVSISPVAPTAADDLNCNAAASDPDGDSVVFAYEWTIDGVISAVTSGSLPSSEFTRGQTITCKVTPNDGDEDGAWAVTGGKTIANSIPEIASIAINPSAPSASDDLTCAVTSSDADGDSVTYTYSWTRNGANAGVSTATLSNVTTSRNDIYTCTATPDDGSDTGVAQSSASATVVNQAPVISSLTLSTASPLTGATLTANPVVSDDDGDSTTLSYEWYVGGALVQSGPSNALSGALHFDKGDSVSAVATANDGFDDSVAVQSSSATVANSPPGAPVVVMDPEAPEASDDLVCMIDTDSFDPDGDAVSYSFAWELNGTEWTGATADTDHTGDTIESVDTTGEDEWSCTATPSDGDEDGATATADETVLASQVVVELGAADLDNQISCMPGGDELISAESTDDWGFSWEDTSGRTPTSVTIEFTMGMVCTASYSPSVELNGLTIDTISPTFDCSGCSVTIPGGQAFSITPADLSSYDSNGVNEVTLDYSMWEGLYPNADGNYAVITIDY
jgi:hypothetical protein